MLHTEQVVSQRGNKDVESDKGPDNSKVAPSIRIVDLRLRNVLIRLLDSAIAAIRSGVPVEQLTTCELEVFTKILSTGLTRRGVENRKFG